jgi:hypothetical protein
MSSLEKFAKFAQPDKLLMVGEVVILKPLFEVLANMYRRWLAQIQLRKQEISMLHSVALASWMASSFQNVTPLVTW